MVHRVVVAALVSDLGVLLVRRRDDIENAAGQWSFPGGHVEPGETEAEALVRELREETGIEVVIVGEPSLHIVENEQSPDGLDISLWVVREWVGVPENSAPDENDDIRWVRASDIAELPLAHWTCRTVIEEHG